MRPKDGTRVQRHKRQLRVAVRDVPPGNGGRLRELDVRMQGIEGTPPVLTSPLRHGFRASPLSPSVAAFDLTYPLCRGLRRDISPSLSILAREGER